ncbi:hypothetical protein M2346_001976 [Sphingobium xanthum]|nr:hypothetical protein [Sphingobium sp. B10D3B]MCW2401956.1 hypothetical protein [Sphingobium sp. B10D7B]MCW2408935.1 hypothetical protein [Sphingobium xanthum]
MPIQLNVAVRRDAVSYDVTLLYRVRADTSVMEYVKRAD